MAYTVAANGAMREAGDAAHNAVKQLQTVIDSACTPGGGVKGDWTARIAAAQVTANTAVDAFEAAIAASVAAPVPPVAVINPAIGYGSMTGALGVAVAPNP